MATSGWLGNRVIHSWGSAYSRFESDVYINSIQRNSTNIRVRGTIYLTCRTNGRYCWYTWPIATSANWNQLGNIKPSTGNTYIQNKQWSKSFDITINCSNTATSATLEIRFSDSNMGTKQQNYTLYFDRYASGPSGMTVSATYTPYRTITSSCSGINWGQGYSSRKLICDATWTYQGRTETVNLGTWTDGATSKTVTKTDFVFPAENLAVNVKWTAQTNINSISAGKQLTVNKTYPEPILNNAVVSAESTGPYKVRASISGVDFSYNYSKRVISCYIDYTLDGVSYSNKIGEITDGSTSLTVEKDASQETNPWEIIPDDNEATIRFVVDNGNGISEKSCSIYCESQYEAYVVGRVPVEEQETDTVEGNSIQISDADNAPLSDFELDGETSQQTYTGKNLVYTTSGTTGGMAATYNAITGETAISGSAQATYAVFGVKTPANFPAGTYTFSIQATAPVAVGIGTWVGGTRTAYAISVGSKSRTITVSGAITEYDIYITGLTVNTYYNFTFKAMFESGSSATSFEPYVGGVPAPNPDYPQPVKVVTGENVVQICGKNLCSSEWESGAYNITTGAKSTGTGYRTADFVAVQPNTTYIVSRASSGVAMNVLEFNSSKMFTYYKGDATSAGSSFTTKADTYYITMFRGASGGIDDMMLEKGSTISTYEAYQGQSYEVNLGKNLFDKDNVSEVINAYIDTSAHKITTGSSYRTAFIPCEPNTTYTISKTLSARFIMATTSDTPTNNVSVSQEAAKNSDTAYTITTNSTAKYLCVFCYHSSYDTLTPEEILATLQIEKGSKATTYAPYFTPIELCKIGTYQDYIYKDGTDWKIHKAVGHRVYGWNVLGIAANNTSSETTISAEGAFQVFFSDSSIPSSDKPNMRLSENIGIYNSSQTISGNLDARSMTDGTFKPRDMSGTVDRIYFRNTGYIGKTGNEVKAILEEKTGGIDLWWFSATPTDTEIMNTTLVAQLEAILAGGTYAGTNNIALIPSGNEQGSLEITYYTKYNDYSQATLLSNGKNGTGQFKQIRRVITK